MPMIGTRTLNLARGLTGNELLFVAIDVLTFGKEEALRKLFAEGVPIATSCSLAVSKATRQMIVPCLAGQQSLPLKTTLV